MGPSARPFAIGLLVLATLTWHTSASGGTLVCSGGVAALSYHANVGSAGSILYLRLSSMNTIVGVCSPDVTWTVSGTPYVTPPESCKALYATLLAARISGLTLSSVWFDGDGVPAACDAWSSWVTANIRYQTL